ncbi:glucans biosynthesis glucosyltransferase MdoH [Stappia taiwanensis]|uniref:Glucans biosynthesis glucosyltransferase H n=1 Tax=Stappia taiwanensis TaxID=992267 RepID=A0A838XU69_9HYPH|nr:glucans biosynthesis glucosyltransferase MdoH [Stappia taiwanensis]
MLGKRLPHFLAPDQPASGGAGEDQDLDRPRVHRPDDARRLFWRRALFLLLVVTSMAGLTALLTMSLAGNGIGWGEGLMIACFVATLPWTVIGFWNAVIGFLVMRLSRDPVESVCPIAPGNASRTGSASTAILSCIRNEDVDQVAVNLDAMAADLHQAGRCEGFSIYVLSDTDQPEIAAREEAVFAALHDRWTGHIDIFYRRRSDNSGFKAGNIRDFCERWGAGHDYALVLDADSFMAAPAILDLVARMDANPRLGILQTLVVGMPTVSAFARIFQFGMRLGMRSYTLGSAWWQGECGPYWGHNAILRLAPFAEHCHLPELPGKGPLAGTILSHDQVEAVLMRRAGYEVRVIPRETESFEENPPNLLEFIRRDLRWCQGNLQYLKLLRMPGLYPLSRLQLLLAILMFTSAPAWLAFMATGAALAALNSGEMVQINAAAGLALFATILTMIFAPKIVTVIDILARRELRTAYGGGVRVVVSALTEIVFSALLAPVMAIAVSLFIAGLPFGRAIGWGAQVRETKGLPLGLCASKLWPQTLFGVSGIAFAAWLSPVLIWPLLPVVLGPALAVPLCMVLSRRDVGELALATRLWRLPEETVPPTCLLPLRLPAHASLGVSFAPVGAMFGAEVENAEA